MFGVYSGLYIIGYLGDVVADHDLPALRIRKGDLWFS
jgi:hypothetical protein